MNTTKKWFEAEKDEARGRPMKGQYSNIFIGSSPQDGMTKETADSYDVFVNVSDSICNTFEPSRLGQHMHWYPVNEMGRWNLSYLFWLKNVLDYHYERGHKIYLHCHAGAYRSPSAAVLWLQSRGHSSQEALTLGKEHDSFLYRLWESNGNVPKQKDAMFALMRKNPTWSAGGIMYHLEQPWNHEVISGGNRTRHLLRKYFWFYYEPKYVIKGWWSNVKYFFKGNGWKHEGYFTTHYTRKHFWSWPVNAERKEK